MHPRPTATPTRRMNEQSEGEQDEAHRRAREIYERLVREHQWDFQNVPLPAPRPAPAAPAPSPPPAGPA